MMLDMISKMMDPYYQTYDWGRPSRPTRAPLTPGERKAIERRRAKRDAAKAARKAQRARR